jgi:hypothetical protein
MEITSFYDACQKNIGSYGSWKLSGEPENVWYSPIRWEKTWKLLPIAHVNGDRNHEKHEFLRRISNQVSVVTVAGNRPRSQNMGKNMKTFSSSPRKWRLKTWKTQIFATPLNPCIGGYGN